MYALAGTDIRAILDGAYDLLGVTDPDELPGAMLAVLDRLVGSELASYNEIDLTHSTATVVTAGGPSPGRELTTVFAQHARENPLVSYQSASGDTSPRRLSDFISARQFHRRPIYNLVYRPLGVETQVAFGLEPSRAGVIGFALSRGRADFSDRDVAVLATLRPLLTQIRASLGRRRTDPESRRSLTRRQRDVMVRLSRGATNHQIALELGISEKTVAKHLEHVFRRLEVTNRTAAVAAWRAASDA